MSLPEVFLAVLVVAALAVGIGALAISLDARSRIAELETRVASPLQLKRWRVDFVNGDNAPGSITCTAASEDEAAAQAIPYGARRVTGCREVPGGPMLPTQPFGGAQA